MSPMRIAVVTTSYPVHDDDPSGHFVRAEVESLIEAGHEVTLFAPRPTQTDAGTWPARTLGDREVWCVAVAPDAPTNAVIEGSAPAARELAQSRSVAVRCGLPHLGLFGWPGAIARMRSAPWQTIGVLPFAVMARRRLTEFGPFDRVVAHWLMPAFWPICRDFDGTAVVVAHGSDVRLLERVPRWLQRRVIAALHRPNVALRCVSAELAQRLRRLGYNPESSPGSELVIEPALIEIPRLPARHELRQCLQIGTPPMALIVGRLVRDKHIEPAILAILAAVAAQIELRETTILVIGDGPMRAELAQRFPTVQWLGRLGRQETLRYIGAADVLVSASRREGAPTVVREALALGTPVVAAEAGDLADWSRRDARLVVIGGSPCQWQNDAPNEIAKQLLVRIRA